MDFLMYIADSLHFTKNIFFGNRIRCIIFLLLGIVSGVLSIYHNAIPHLENNRICWQVMYSWWIWGGLLVLWLLTNTVIAGFMIRVFRDPVSIPSFDNIKNLIYEGIIAVILIAVWAVPVLAGTFFSASPFILIALLLFLILVFPVSLFLFATTGDFRESLRISNILSTIRNSKLIKYLAAWGIVILGYLLIVVVTRIFWFAVMLFPLVPSIPVTLVKYGIFGYATLLLTIFFARLFTNVLGKHNAEEGIGTER